MTVQRTQSRYRQKNNMDQLKHKVIYRQDLDNKRSGCDCYQVLCYFCSCPHTWAAVALGLPPKKVVQLNWRLILLQYLAICVCYPVGLCWRKILVFPQFSNYLCEYSVTITDENEDHSYENYTQAAINLNYPLISNGGVSKRQLHHVITITLQLCHK